MLKQTLFIIPVLVLMLLQGCSSDSESQGDNLIAKTEFSLNDTAGQTINVKKEVDSFVMEGENGKVVIYDIFATWCPPCRASATHLTSLQEKFKDELKVVGLSIEEDIDAKALEVFKQENNAQYTIAFGKQSILLGRSIASSIHIGQSFPIPLMVMYKDGKYVNHYTGLIPEEMIENDIRLALGKQ
jgi:thiol-disulfide isomerase/thioredoxin